MGPVQFLLYNQRLEQIRFDGIVTHESMFRVLGDGTVVGQLVEAWEVDRSGRVFILELRKGAKWHSNFGDWGEFDADDFLFSVEQVTQEGSTHNSRGNIGNVFRCDGCTLEKIDSHTIKLTRPSPTYELTWYSRQPQNTTLSMHSKKHFEAVGEEAAAAQSVGTGPWEMVEAVAEESREVRGVSDHWRRTPDWEGMRWFGIPEEASRLANFQVGNIDTASLNPDSIQFLKRDRSDGVRFMSFPGADGIYLNFLGQQYNPDHPAHQPSADGNDAPVPMPEGTEYTSRCRELVYVSCNRDVDSAEWGNARKIREALAIAIDRQKLVDNLLFGEGAPDYLTWWDDKARAESLGLDQLSYEFDPARAKQLLAEAGVPDGFGIEFALPLFLDRTTSIFAGEAVAAMWQDVGVESKLKQLTYSEFRPGLVQRTHGGVFSLQGGPSIEPLRVYRILYNADSRINFGFEHPIFQDMITKAEQTRYEDARWEIMGEMATFIFDNVISIPLFTRNSVWPLGPNIDRWEPLNRVYDWLSNWEEVPHRQ